MINALILENDRDEQRTPSVSACEPPCAILPSKAGQNSWKKFCAKARQFTGDESIAAG